MADKMMFDSDGLTVVNAMAACGMDHIAHVKTKCRLNTLPQKSLATSLLCAWRSHSRNSTNTSRLTVTCQSPRVGSKSALGSNRTSKLFSNGLVTSCDSTMSHQLLPFPLIASLTLFVATRHLRKVIDGSAG